MAGDPIYDCTSTGFTVTPTSGWTSNTEPTCTNYANYPTRTYTSYITYTFVDRKTETKKEKKERLKQENISYMISLFSDFVLPVKVKPVRPSIQLRGVSYGGRGWA